jgi:hypothetical protein
MKKSVANPFLAVVLNLFQNPNLSRNSLQARKQKRSLELVPA